LIQIPALAGDDLVRLAALEIPPSGGSRPRKRGTPNVSVSKERVFFGV
jgi:hypothetical protein